MFRVGFSVLVVLIAFLPTNAHSQTNAQLTAKVQATENAFAATMANRDFDAFATFLTDESVFFSGEQPLQGKEMIKSVWSTYYAGDAAPFSWRSETVVVLPSGTLAHSSGPVMNSDGQEVATFNSVWRLEAGGEWKVIFDKGCNKCQ